MPRTRSSRTSSGFSEENHTMLVQLRDNVGSLGTTLNTFIEAQGEENRRLHARIDAANNNIVTAVGSIKDTIAERSRITPSLIAMIISSLAIISGGGAFFITLSTNPLKTDIQNNMREIGISEAQRLQMSRDLVALQISTAREDAKQAEAHRWEEMLILDNKTRVTKLEEQQHQQK